MRKHAPMVVRGDSNFGAAGLHCSTCHHDANFDTAGVPGAPNWMLAPKEMAWQGETLGNICRQIKDRKRNGDKDMPALIHHMAEDTLVGWGWHPGGNRSPAPGTPTKGTCVANSDPCGCFQVVENGKAGYTLCAD